MTQCTDDESTKEIFHKSTNMSVTNKPVDESINQLTNEHKKQKINESIRQF